MNVNLGAKTEMSQPGKASLYGSLFEDIAVLLSAGVIEDTGGGRTVQLKKPD